MEKSKLEVLAGGIGREVYMYCRYLTLCEFSTALRESIDKSTIQQEGVKQT